MVRGSVLGREHVRVDIITGIMHVADEFALVATVVVLVGDMQETEGGHLYFALLLPTSVNVVNPVGLHNTHRLVRDWHVAHIVPSGR